MAKPTTVTLGGADPFSRRRGIRLDCFSGLRMTTNVTAQPRCFAALNILDGTVIVTKWGSLRGG
jgi:hypothetical protein